MKVHILNILVYLLAIAFIVAGIIIFEQPVLLLLLFPFLIFPALELPFFFRTVSSVSCKLLSKAEYVIIGNEVPVSLTLHNPSFYPFLSCNMEYYVNNLFFTDKKRSSLSFAIMPKEDSECNILLESNGCGMVSLQADKIMLTDLLGFITMEKPFPFRIDVPVLPETGHVEPLPQNAPSDGLEEYEESDLKGNLSSDVKEIREYRPGDRIQRIHWKLSAKLDELFVKEMAHTSILSLVILPELCRNHLDSTLPTLMGLSKMLLKEEERFEICLYNHSACEFKFLTIIDSEALINAFYELYYLPIYDTGNLAREYYYSSAQKDASVIHVKGTHVEIINSDK